MAEREFEIGLFGNTGARLEHVGLPEEVSRRLEPDTHNNVFFVVPEDGSSRIENAFIVRGEFQEVSGKDGFGAARQIFSNGHVSGTIYELKKTNDKLAFDPVLESSGNS